MSKFCVNWEVVVHPHHSFRLRLVKPVQAEQESGWLQDDFFVLVLLVGSAAAEFAARRAIAVVFASADAILDVAEHQVQEVASQEDCGLAVLNNEIGQFRAADDEVALLLEKHSLAVIGNMLNQHLELLSQTGRTPGGFTLHGLEVIVAAFEVTKDFPASVAIRERDVGSPVQSFHDLHERS